MDTINNNGDLPDLPEGMSFEDLRYYDPQSYAMHMAMKGWTVFASRGVDGNEAKVNYTLQRTVGTGFDDQTYWQFLLERGIAIDADQFADGYNSGLFTETTPESDGHLQLRFSFEGFPTQATLSNLNALEKYFDKPSLVKRWLGKLSRD